MVAIVPLIFLVVYVVQRGGDVLSWAFLTENPPFSDRLPGGGMAPAVVGTLLITGAAALMAIPLGVLGGIYLNEYGGRSPLARADPLPLGGDDGRALDRDGPLHLHVRGVAHARAERLRRRAGAWAA